MPDEVVRAKRLMAHMDKRWGPLPGSRGMAATPSAAPRDLRDPQDRWGQPRSIGDNVRVRRQLTSGRR